MPTGTQSPFQTTVDSIESHFVPALLTTIFCCIPFGIVSLIYSGKVSAAKEEDDFDAALDASRKARGWYRASIIASIIVNVLALFLGLIGILAGNT